MKNTIKPENVLFKIGTLLIALFSPILFIIFCGFNSSISSYWMSDLQPLFIFGNALTSYYLFTNPSWRYPSTFLLLLTAFSVEHHKEIHNTVAIIFFIVCLIVILKDKRYRFFAIPYISSIFWFRGLDEMLIAEMIAIYTICMFHTTELVHFLILDWKRKKR
jgi:hypothetical protein